MMIIQEKSAHYSLSTMVIAAYLMLVPAGTWAEIYRYVDDQGNVHFSDEAPENREADNIKTDIEEAVKRNTLPSPETQRQNDPEWIKSLREQREKDALEKIAEKASHDKAIKDWKQAVQDAKERLKKAKTEQKAGKDAIDGDFVGKVGGGARPSEQYFQRQIDLAARVKAAEEALATLKKQKPKANN